MTKLDKTVYFVRHLQGIDNTQPLFQSTASPLSKEGKAQAHKIANRLASPPFEILITSPLPRANETAKYIASKKKVPIISKSLFVKRISPPEIL